mgnify:CR=1 FL=1
MQPLSLKRTSWPLIFAMGSALITTATQAENVNVHALPLKLSLSHTACKDDGSCKVVKSTLSGSSLLKAALGFKPASKAVEVTQALTGKSLGLVYDPDRCDAAIVVTSIGQPTRTLNALLGYVDTCGFDLAFSQPAEGRSGPVNEFMMTDFSFVNEEADGAEGYLFSGAAVVSLQLMLARSGDTETPGTIKLLGGLGGYSDSDSDSALITGVAASVNLKTSQGVVDEDAVFDDDADGVLNGIDACPETEDFAEVDGTGCDAV